MSVDEIRAACEALAAGDPEPLVSCGANLFANQVGEVSGFD